MFAQKTVGTVFRKCFLFFFVLLSYVNIGLILKKKTTTTTHKAVLSVFKKPKMCFVK